MRKTTHKTCKETHKNYKIFIGVKTNPFTGARTKIKKKQMLIGLFKYCNVLKK